ncbi:MAG: aminotransferase class V-fold PLP-dependent enzyme [Alphaproteobacteria bacterium]|nr:aminotransferase class V-fold PLP-dependent enzyme [Alphaproteobacteria bacterium]
MSNMQIPFVDLKLRFEDEKAELLACVERVLSKGHLVMTPEVAELERAVEDYTGARHCIGLNSGTDGLLMALWAAGIRKEDEVITTPVSFVATVGAIVHVGATPVFADVRRDQNIDPAEIEKKITPRTKAIMPVHWTGRMADMDAILNIAERHGLMVVEDSAQSMGSRADGKHGGTFGFAGAISCHPLKNLNAVGDGGMMLTDNDEAAEKVRLYRNHGLESRDSVAIFGINSRLDVLNAEVLKFRLTKLDDIIARRRHNANLYRELIEAPEVFIPEEKDGASDSYVMFIVQAERRDALKAHLAGNGIESLIYYGTPLHLHKAAQRFGYKKGDMPEAERQCDLVLALPHHQHLTEDQVIYVAEHVNGFYGAA